MSSLDFREKRFLESLFRMSSGYVLGFSDRTFGEFFYEVADIDIHSEQYQRQGHSKAKKLRTFWEDEPDHIVGEVLLGLVEIVSDSQGQHQENIENIRKGRAIANRLLAGAVSFDDLAQNADSLGATQIQQQIKRMEQSIESDPALAIGTAKEMIETCCKTILAERGVPLPKKSPDISDLTKAVMRELRLVPEYVPEQARGADTIKRILGNLASIGGGIAELRNLYGTGHGQDGKATSLSPRHARLAVGSASTLVNFLFETHKEQTNQGDKVA